MTDKRILIGEIGAAHGIKGFVKVRIYAENLDLFATPLFTDESSDKTLSLSLKNSMKDGWLAQIKDVHDRTAAEQFRNTKLYVNRSVLPEPDDDEFYYTDLVGLECVDEDRNPIGKVVAVQNFGAGDLLDIQPLEGESFYLPFTQDTVLDVIDVIIISIPEGLRE